MRTHRVLTLVVSDLHLGSVLDRDVVRRRPAARQRLLDAVAEADRLVLLGDTVEMLEGRPEHALAQARPVLRALGRALPPGAEVVLVPGNHDHALLRPWRRAQHAAGLSLTLDGRVPPEPGSLLAEVVAALGSRTVEVRYPAVWLAEGVLATHGHYVDAHLLPELPRRLPPGRWLAPPIGPQATVDDYETSPGGSLAGLQNLLAAATPGPVGALVDAGAGGARRALLASTRVALPWVERLPTTGLLAPLAPLSIAHRLPGLSVAALEQVVARLAPRAEHVIFGHVHRAGPLPGDEPATWRVGPRRYTNTGCWVWDGVLLAGAASGHPYWPGRAVQLRGGEAPRVVALLDDVGRHALRA